MENAPEANKPKFTERQLEGQELLRARIRRRGRDKDVAKYLNMDSSRLSRILNGLSGPSLAERKQLLSIAGKRADKDGCVTDFLSRLPYTGTGRRRKQAALVPISKFSPTLPGLESVKKVSPETGVVSPRPAMTPALSECVVEYVVLPYMKEVAPYSKRITYQPGVPLPRIGDEIELTGRKTVWGRVIKMKHRILPADRRTYVMVTVREQREPQQRAGA